MRTNLASINVPYHSILHGNSCCIDDTHKIALEQYYSDIMLAVIKAESILPKTNPNFERSFWDDNLSELKARSIECNIQALVVLSPALILIVEKIATINIKQNCAGRREAPKINKKKKCTMIL